MDSEKRSHPAFKWMLIAIGLTLLFFLNLTLGSVSIPLKATFSILTGNISIDPVWRGIILDFRLTKALTCIMAGSALSLAGLFMQTLFRNPLAGPDVFGLSSGASLLVAIVFMTGLTFVSGSLTVAAAACLGSAGVFIIILLISTRIRDNTSLLLIGLMIGAGTSSIVSVLQFISRSENQHYYLIWTFGSLAALDWMQIAILAMVCAAGYIAGISEMKSLNAWLLGDNYAKSLGINMQRSRVIIIIASSILAGGVTAFCGPIAFVGIAVPHLARMLMKTTDHKILIPASMLMGAALMLFCDTIAQLPGQSRIIPVNAVTSLIGAPVVIWIILRSKKIVI